MQLKKKKWSGNIVGFVVQKSAWTLLWLLSGLRIRPLQDVDRQRHAQNRGAEGWSNNNENASEKNNNLYSILLKATITFTLLASEISRRGGTLNQTWWRTGVEEISKSLSFNSMTVLKQEEAYRRLSLSVHTSTFCVITFKSQCGRSGRGGVGKVGESVM